MPTRTLVIEVVRDVTSGTTSAPFAVGVVAGDCGVFSIALTGFAPI